MIVPQKSAVQPGTPLVIRPGKDHLQRHVVKLLLPADTIRVDQYFGNSKSRELQLPKPCASIKVFRIKRQMNVNRGESGNFCGPFEKLLSGCDKLPVIPPLDLKEPIGAQLIKLFV